jgi:hypothetical protein
MVVQAYWVECFEARIASIRLDNPTYTNPEARMAALKEACNTLGWQEKDLRNKMYAPLRFPSQMPSPSSGRTQVLIIAQGCLAWLQRNKRCWGLG